ncbi:MAG: redoxin domain-containing protein [Armatimonadetes bacterium]|nr:redoxin domain-containing protein [Armatimonadota bacterium]
MIPQQSRETPRPKWRLPSGLIRRTLMLTLMGLPVLSLSVFARAPLPGKPSGTALPNRAGAASAPVAAGIGQTAKGLSFRDVKGKPYTLADLSGSKATVFLFIGTECPIANGYTPRIRNMGRSFQRQGVRTFAVYSNRNETKAQVLRHAMERDLPFPIVKDETGDLARRLGAKFTPEAIVLDSSGAVRYRGRIDDSKESVKVTRADLRDAIAAILAGKPVARPETKAFGCAIALAEPKASAKPAVALAPKVTFAKDIAPILQQNCQSCHRPGEVGPMSLMTYEQASAFAQGIKAATQRKSMPPWHAAEGHGEFENDRSLSDEQIRLIAEWADTGAPLGNPKDLPAPVQFPRGWQLGEPDRVYHSPEPYAVAADGPDVYRNYVLPTGFDEDMYVTAVEVRPDKKAIVHHVIAYIDDKPDGKGRSLEWDAKDPGPGYTSSGAGINFDPSGMLGGWAPGNEPRFLPDGVAIKLPKGSRIVLQVHYHKNGVATRDQTRIGVHFAKKPVRKLTFPYPIANGNMVIPAGAKDHRVEARGNAPLDVHAFAVMPHMHTLGRRMKVTATKPDGTAVPLVYVPKWDFRWQNTYTYKEPVALPRGTKVLVEAWYDNSADNPHNPNTPPKEVRWGEQTTDEMILAYIWVTVDAENLSITPRTVEKQASLRP